MSQLDKAQKNDGGCGKYGLWANGKRLGCLPRADVDGDLNVGFECVKS